MRLVPAPGWVVLELEDTAYKGTLVIPDTAKDAPSRGIVTAVGPPKDPAIPSHTFVGEKVLFPKYSGADVEFDGKKYLVLAESEIICYIEEDGNG